MAYIANQTISPLPLVKGYGKRKLIHFLTINSPESQYTKYIFKINMLYNMSAMTAS